MAQAYTLHKALPSDAPAISRLFALSKQSPFSHLKRYDVDSGADINGWIAERTTWKSMHYMVARDTSSGEVVSAAHWTEPEPNAAISEEHMRSIAPPSQAEMEDRWKFRYEFFFDLLPETSNRELIMECDTGVWKMRDRIIDHRPYFRLVELGTHPEHRGHGLASRLIRNMLDMVDERGTLAYLEMEEEYVSRGLYEKLGFEERDRETIEDLSKFASKEERERVGAGNRHTHVGFVRDPIKHWTELGY